VTEAGSASALARIVASLDAAGIPHRVAGSFASTHHGAPRTTQDIDIVIDPSRDALDRFVASVDPASFYVSDSAADEAWRRRGAFNVIDLASGWKIDLILVKQRAFSREEFARRQPARIAGVDVFVATAEDTILAKLEWAREGESERQLRDVAGVLEVCGDALDRAYVERWAGVLGLADLWQRVQADRSA
jgi:hypothetical protein